jgi:NADPH:quinone reductase-like Zn-dependent oxidoreductase
MLIAQYEQRGPVPQDVIQAVEVEQPKPAAGQALVAVLAAPINPSDVLTLTGQYGMLPPLPAIGGMEGVGRVVALGSDIIGPAVGQTVLLPAGIGTWRTHLTVDAARLIPLPNEADPQQLAMMTINPPTASLLLSEFKALKAGDWVVQNAANSGVGGYLTQLARINGYKTANVVRRESAEAQVRENGADVVLTDGDDLAQRLAEATGGAKIMLGIDAVGGTATDRLAECLGDGATLVNYGIMSGEACLVSPRSIIFRDLTIRGFWLAKWIGQTPVEKQQALYAHLTGLIVKAELKARIHATYTIAQIKDAVAAAAQGERSGKILVVP